MMQKLRLLLVEDVEDDAQLLLLELRNGGIDPDYLRVDTAEQLKAALENGPWDAIFVDYNLPSFNGLDALGIVQAKGLDIPFILVSGAIGEEQAVEALKAGAHDFIMKGNYARLLLALDRALQDAALRRERRQSAEELTRYREHLEDLVQQRTEELAAANEELQKQGEELRSSFEELQRIERELRESEEQVRLMVEGVQDYAIFMLDPQGHVLTWNSGAERINGYRAKEIIGRHFSCFYCPDDLERGAADLALKTAEVEGRYEEEGCRVRRDESQYWANALITALHDEQGNLRGFSKVTRDITERKHVEEALQRAHEELEKRVEERTAELREKDQMLLLQSRQAAMGEMIGNIAHQWRQPLNALALTIQQLLIFYDMGEFTREFLSKSISQTMELIRHMSGTIDDFRNFFRPDKERAEFNLQAVVASTLSLVEDSFRSQNISIDVSAKADPVIFGYRNEYAQVLLNILNNARDVLLERKIVDSRVMIDIFSEGDRSVLTVSDKAGGIPEEIIDRIFEPYFTTKGPHEGTGVGLFMSKTIIEKNMEGRLSVRNIADGAEFRIEV